MEGSMIAARKCLGTIKRIQIHPASKDYMVTLKDVITGAYYHKTVSPAYYDKVFTKAFAVELL